MDMVVPGVGVGGLNDKYEIKILICYLLYSVKAPLARDQLGLIFQEEQLVNYFSFCDALTELLETGHLAADGSPEAYTLGPLGVETAERLARNLPKSLRDNVVSAAMKLISRLKLERENQVDIQPCRNGFTVACASYDGAFEMMRLELYAPDELQAQQIKARFLADPVRIYRSVIGLLADPDGQ